MGLHFVGGERIQRGSGIGGLLRIASKLFFPIAKVAQKVLQSDTGKQIVGAVKNQAINSSINIANDIAEGKNVKESFKNEFENAKQNSKRKAIDIGADFVNKQILSPKKSKKNINKKGKKNKNKSFKKDIFN